MSKYVLYAPDQDWLLPPRTIDELGPGHVVFFLHELVERLDLSSFEQDASEEGRPGYPPQLLLKVWLYAYSLGVTSSRKLERRIREDLGFRFLAGNLKPDHWTLNEFRRRHPRGLNDVFTQVVEAARRLGLGKLGRVAIDSTRIQANASADRSDTIEQLRRERARIRQRIRRWQQQANQDDDNETPGSEAEPPQTWRKRLAEIPRQLEQLRQSGQQRGSRSDPESRYLKRRGGFCLGYTAELAVSDDHFIVACGVHQRANDAGSLAAMVAAVEDECGQTPAAVLADCGYSSSEQMEAVEQRGVETYVPDRLLATEMAGGPQVTMNRRQQRRHPGLLERRQRLRGQRAREYLARRKALVEAVFGVLKEQRGMRQFRRRGLAAVASEWKLAATAFNLTRWHGLQAALAV